MYPAKGEERKKEKKKERKKASSLSSAWEQENVLAYDRGSRRRSLRQQTSRWHAHDPSPVSADPLQRVPRSDTPEVKAALCLVGNKTIITIIMIIITITITIISDEGT